MRINVTNFVSLSQFKTARGQVAYTLVEIMVTAAIMMMVLAGIIETQYFGMQMYQITKAKLGASDQARAAISKLVDEIRSCKIVKVGAGSLGGFTQDPDGVLEIGGALQIYATTNTNNFIRYFFDPADKKLKRTTNGLGYALVIADSISNSIVFSEEDFAGNVVTNQNNRVIGVMLQFYQISYPIINIGPGGLFDFYQLHTRITRRVLE